MPSVATSPAATPQPSVDSGLPVETAAPAKTTPKPQIPQSHVVPDPTHILPTAKSGKPIKDTGSTASGPEEEAIGSPTDGASKPVVSRPGANTQPGASDGVAAILSMFLTQGSKASQVADKPQRPASGPGSRADHGVVISAGGGVHTALSSGGSIILDGKPLVDGQATVVSGQTISAESGTIVVNGIPQHHSVMEGLSTPQGIFTVAGKEHTAVQQPNGAVEIDGKSHNLGAAATIDGSAITIAYGAVIVGATTVPYAQSPAKNGRGAIFAVNGHVYSADSKSGLLRINGAPAFVGDKITTNGDVLTIGSHAINVEGATIYLTDGQPMEPTQVPHAQSPADNEHGRVFTVNGDVYTVNGQPGSLRVNGASASVGQEITTNGVVLTVGSYAINVEGTAIPLTGGQLMAPTPTAEANVVISGESMTALKDGSNVVIAGTTLTMGQFTTILGTRISVVSNGIVVGSSTATFHGPDSTTAKPSDAVTIDGIVYHATSLAEQSDAVVLDGQTISKGGPAATIHGQVVTLGPNGISIVDPAASATVSSGANHVISVITIDGVTYTATPVPGRSGVVVLNGQTISIGGSGMTIAHHFITEGSDGISIASPTSSTSDSTSRPSSSEDMTGSSTMQQSPAETSDPDESSAFNLKVGFGSVLLGATILLLM